MMRTLQTITLFFLVALLIGQAGGVVQAQTTSSEQYSPGLIVTMVEKGSAAEQAGLRPGDLLLSLDGTPLRFDSQIPPIRDKALWNGKKTISFAFKRNMQSLDAAIVVGPHIGVSARPPMSEATQKLYDEASALPVERTAEILAKLHSTAEAAGKESDTRAAAWLWFNALGTGALVIGNPLYDNARRAGMLAAATNAYTLTHLPNQSKNGTKVASAANPANRRSGELGIMTRDGVAPPQLGFAEEEAKHVAALYRTTAHIGVEPTEAWFRRQVGHFKILHLATHGLFNPDAPLSSGILLAVPEKMPVTGEYDNDGTLQAWEVWSLKVKAALVILSACETGRGLQVNGEGLIGLTRAWQYAGAQTIVSSQWKVNDASTSALMVAFHQHLKAGFERDEALRQAMADIAHDKAGRWSAPYHWAPFVLVGQTGKMP